MVFNRKDVFRHDFGSEGAKPVSVALRPAAVDGKPAAGKAQTNQNPKGSKAAAASLVTSNAPSSASSSSTLTTAEAIAAELRAVQEAMPAPSNATFAPDCLNPANAVPTARRSAGANLAGFKTIAKGMFQN